MLWLDRRIGERISLGDSIEVIVVDVIHGKVRLGIQAPRDVPVHREEIQRLIEAAKQQKVG